MASPHFANLAQSLAELKRIYLDDALNAPLPTPDHQELARAFQVLAHAEFEYFAEEALRDLATHTFKGASSGKFGRPALALIAFSALEPIKGGAVLVAGKKKPRELATRFGEAHAALVAKISKNCGVREKHLAAMAVPLGLSAAAIDNTWLNDLDAFCTSRGAYAHTSRTSKNGNYLATNPKDIWTKCERIVWTNPALTPPGVISSFESFDDWIEGEKLSLGSIVTAPVWRLRVSHLISVLINKIRRTDHADDDDA